MSHILSEMSPISKVGASCVEVNARARHAGSRPCWGNDLQDAPGVLSLWQSAALYELATRVGSTCSEFFISLFILSQVVDTKRSESASSDLTYMKG